MNNVPPAGWFPDPSVPGQQRYWDGARWTEHTAPAAAPVQQPQAPVAPVAPVAPQAPFAPQPPVAPYVDLGPGYLPAAGQGQPGAKGLTMPERVSAIAIVVVVLASFLPWVSFAGISANGLSGDGVITLVIGLVGAVLLAVNTGLLGGQRRLGAALPITLVVLAALVALIGLIDMNGLAAIGLYLTLFGGIAWLVGAIWQLVQRTKATA